MISVASADNILEKVKSLFSKGENKEEKSADTEEEIITKSNEQEILNTILKKITDINTEVNSKITQVESRISDIEEKIENKDEINDIKDNILKVQTTLSEFGKFYELVCRQYDPFTEEKEATEKEITPKPESKTEKSKSKEAIEKEKTINSNEQLDKKETEAEEEVNTLIKAANKHVDNNKIKEAQKEYKKIMEFYKSVENQKLKVKIYTEAVKILEKINSAK